MVPPVVDFGILWSYTRLVGVDVQCKRNVRSALIMACSSTAGVIVGIFCVILIVRLVQYDVCPCPRQIDTDNEQP
jgi:hypothetical protein